MNKTFENEEAVITGATNKFDFVDLGERGLPSALNSHKTGLICCDSIK